MTLQPLLWLAAAALGALVALRLWRHVAISLCRKCGEPIDGRTEGDLCRACILEKFPAYKEN